MNATLLVLLIGCGLLQQAITESPLKLSDEVESNQLKSSKYYPSSPEYIGSLPKFAGGGGGSLGPQEYFLCKKTIFNSFEPVDTAYSISPTSYGPNYGQNYALRRSDRLAKRFQNNNLIYEYKMNNYQDELLPKPTRKSDDPKIFRNLFLGSRG